MKIFIIVALAIAAVVAEPEADPALVYTDGNFHTNLENLQKGVNTQYVKPYGAVYQTLDAPKVYSPFYSAVAPAAVPAYQPYYAAASPYRLYKREAEAEAEAKPEAQYYYNGAYPYAAAGAYAAYKPVYSAAAYQPYAAYNPYGYQGYRLYKREAEAEAEPEAKPEAQYYYNGAYPYATAAYSAYKQPAVYASAAAYQPYAAAAYQPYAAAAYQPYSAYQGYRLYKREAEAEAEAKPQYYYGGYPYATAGAYATYKPAYATYPYAAGYNYAAYRPYF